MRMGRSFPVMMVSQKKRNKNSKRYTLGLFDTPIAKFGSPSKIK